MALLISIGLKGAKVSGDMDCMPGRGDLVGNAAGKLATKLGGLHVRTEIGVKNPDCGHFMFIGVVCKICVFSEPLNFPWPSVPSTFMPKGVAQCA